MLFIITATGLLPTASALYPYSPVSGLCASDVGSGSVVTSETDSVVSASGASVSAETGI
ncbi:MAG: hypothetical protein IKH50_03950 [Oscillospiraceae bacterium]|nr:hypothetical protein [Oscillospiraceae bacterium]